MADWHFPYFARDDRPAELRAVPHGSGEAAIYSIEYLARREGNANGAVEYEPSGDTARRYLVDD